jgi:hypothetical protein
MEQASKTKDEEDWGLQNIHSFGLALGAKSNVKLMNHRGLWKQVMLTKYIDPLTLDGWIKLLVKELMGISIIWKHFS